MFPSLAWPMLLVLVAGGMVALQAPTNAMLAKTSGSVLFAALISFSVGILALIVVLLSTTQRPVTSALGSLPWYAWLGGLYGAIYVSVVAYAAPRIGLASLITIGIAGQLLMALWLDSVGAFGLQREPIGLARITGALLVLCGVMLVRRG